MAPPAWTSSGMARRVNLPPDGPVCEPEMPVTTLACLIVPWPGTRGSLFLSTLPSSLPSCWRGLSLSLRPSSRNAPGRRPWHRLRTYIVSTPPRASWRTGIAQYGAGGFPRAVRIPSPRHREVAPSFEESRQGRSGDLVRRFCYSPHGGGPGHFCLALTFSREFGVPLALGCGQSLRADSLNLPVG